MKSNHGQQMSVGCCQITIIKFRCRIYFQCFHIELLDQYEVKFITYRKEAIDLKSMKVRVKNNNVEIALRIFKRKVKENHLITRLKEVEHYEKPSEKRNRKKSAAKLREQRRQNANNKPRKSY